MQATIVDLPVEELQVILNPRMELIFATRKDKYWYNIPITNGIAIIISDEYNTAGS